MPDDDVTDAADTDEGSTPAEGAELEDDAAEDEGSTPDSESDDESDDADDDEGDDTDEGDEADTEDDDSDDDEDDDEADDKDDDVETEDPEDDPEWKNLAKKFAHIRNPRDRRAAIARAYWGKATHARRVATENKALRRELQQLKRGAPKKDADETGQPSPGVAAAEAKITRLNERLTSIRDRVLKAVDKVNGADRDVAIAKHVLDNISDADEEKEHKQRLAKARIKDAEAELERVTERYRDLQEDLAEQRERISVAEQDRDWVKNFEANQAKQQKDEEQEREQFDTEFPKQVDRLILKSAKKLGIDIKDKPARRALIRNVNRSLIVELGQHGNADLKKIGLPGLVRGFVKEYASERDLLKRKEFSHRSKEKLRVTGRTTSSGGKAPDAPRSRPDVPASQRPPVPVSLMGGSPTDKMAQARARLVRRVDGR